MRVCMCVCIVNVELHNYYNRYVMTTYSEFSFICHRTVLKIMANFRVWWNIRLNIQTSLTDEDVTEK